MTKVKSPGDKLLTKPTTGIAGCCALGVTGHATAEPPSSVMKSRRFKWHPTPRSHELVQDSEIPKVSQDVRRRCDNLSAVVKIRVFTGGYLSPSGGGPP